MTATGFARSPDFEARRPPNERPRAGFFQPILSGVHMKSLKNLLRNVWTDERGGEVIEYALIIGLIVVAAIAIIATVGTKVVGRWTSVNNSL
jgi:Flp pilus assembly pilin Flp